MNRMSVERLRRRLDASRGQWRATAAVARVSYKTLWRFANGVTRQPWSAFLARLDSHFKRLDGRGR